MSYTKVENYISLSWSDLVGVTYSNGALTRSTAHTGAWDARAKATSYIGEAGGSVEFTIPQKEQSVFVGLDSQSNSTSTLQIDFAFYIYSNAFEIYEGGNPKLGVPIYEANDTFKITVKDRVVTFFHNGALVYTSSTQASPKLYIYALFFTEGAIVKDTKMRYTFTPTAPQELTKTIVYTHLRDFYGNKVTSNAAMTVVLDNGFTALGQFVAQFKKQVSFDEEGYAAIAVVPSPSASVTYSFIIEYMDGDTRRVVEYKSVEVPNQPEVMLQTIT